MEKLLKEISKFARANREALKLAEQWLNEFDYENLEDAWIRAGQPFDWQKIVFIAWLASDEKIYECKLGIDGFDLRQWCGCDKNEGSLTPQKDFLINVIYHVGKGSYHTPKSPNFYLIRSALDEGKKAIASKNHSNDLLKEKKSAIKGKDCWHNKDFTSVVWYGTEYIFNKTQGLCIECLWRNECLSEKTIGEDIGSSSDNYRLIHTFREHPAWMEMIVKDSCRKGIFRLSEKK